MISGINKGKLFLREEFAIPTILVPGTDGSHIMDWREALDIVVAVTGHARYRELCDADHPGHEAWRARMIDKATGAPTPPRGDVVVAGSGRPAPTLAYPPLAVQAANLAAAVGRVAVAAVTGEAVTVPKEEYGRRLAICVACDRFDPAAGRCRDCGCYTARKLSLAQEACPLDPPKWGRWSPPTSTPAAPPGTAG